MLCGGSRTQSLIKKISSNIPLVTIITIVFNGEKYIEKTILSVLNQTYSNIEYIIIDGGSKDSTIDIIKKHEKKIDYWISESDKGIADAFNKGISRATGEIIGIINADDWYELNTVSLIIEALNNGDVIYGNLQCWKNNKKDYLYMADHHFLKYEMSINHPTVFVKKKIYEKFGMFSADYKIAMDYEFFLRLLCNDVKFYYLNQVLANMRLEGISSKNFINGFSEVRRAKSKHLKKSILNYFYFIKQVFTTIFPQIMNKLGFSFIVKFYRNYFSVIRKRKV